MLSTSPSTTTSTMGDTDSNTAINNLSTALSGLQASSRKPDLPPFDVKNIDKWIKRVESAYIRSGVTLPQEKFAFVESKIGVDVDPTIDEFLFGDPTQEQWSAFCAYLRQRYGPSKRQRVAAVLEPIKRDGMTPSNFFSRLKDMMGDITLDEVVKEICIRSLPSDVQQTICKATESMGAQDTMKYADSFFANDGSRLHKPVPSINNIERPPSVVQQQQPQFTTAFNDQDSQEQAEVNAAFSRPRPSQQSNYSKKIGNTSNGNSGSKSSGQNNNRFGNSQGGNSFANNNSTVCSFHERFGERARQCRKPCSWKDQGNGQGHQRM